MKGEIEMELNQTLLKCGLTENYIKEICAEASKKGIYSVSVFPSMVKTAATVLKGTKVRVCSSISYPLGADAPVIKIEECRNAIADGAQEVSLVMNAAALKSGMLDIVKEEVKGVVDVAKKLGCVVKVMIEMPLLTKEEAVCAIEIADSLGVDTIQTSTGFKPLQKRDITKEDIELVLSTVKHAKVEALGTFNNPNIAEEMLVAGAHRVASDVAITFFEVGS